MKRKLWYFWGNDPGEKHIEIWYIPLNKNLKLSLKNGREPELCEPELCEPFLWNYVNHGSHFPLVHTFPWFT